MSSSGRFYRVKGKRMSEAEYKEMQAAQTAKQLEAKSEPKSKKSSTDKGETE